MACSLLSKAARIRPQSKRTIHFFTTLGESILFTPAARSLAAMLGTFAFVISPFRQLKDTDALPLVAEADE